MPPDRSRREGETITTAMPPDRNHRTEETSTCKPAAPPTSIHDLPGDLLELVFLHADSFVCLVRAAATCKPWRRVISDPFLRRFGRFGHYYHEPPSKPLFVPSPAPPGEATVDVHRLAVSLDFLAHHYDHGDVMELSDGGSLLAFVKNSSSVVVCDPCTRKQMELYPQSPWERNPGRYHSCTFGAFLLNAGDGDTSSCSMNMSSFRLLCVSLVRDDVTRTKTAWATLISSRHDGCWWRALGSRDVGAIMPRPSSWISARTKFLGRAGGSLCWSGQAVSNAVLRLDESSGTFSIFKLPAHARRNHWSSYYNRENLRVVDGGTGFVRLARIIDDDLEVLWWSHDGGHECIVERKVCLSQLAGIELIKIEWSWRFLDTAETLNPGHVVLLPFEEYMWMFDVNVETMKLTRLRKSKNGQAGRVFPYELPWPPTIKFPSIHGEAEAAGAILAMTLRRYSTADNFLGVRQLTRVAEEGGCLPVL
ncbi:hypothetical protein HU200_003530 [Digitaria exilis]|uniref:F-box domain-containing protein n=1 Tax=Digitaria exilis TaxID=1010633 RepID=A0A835KY86_9POAL|nr:hypothetical protein HU200_003530 [Digitaria exilis]